MCTLFKGDSKNGDDTERTDFMLEYEATIEYGKALLAQIEKIFKI